MNIRSLLFILLIGYTSSSIAQETKIKIYGERADNLVRMAWIPESWPSSLEGIIIQRRTEKSLWELVTEKLVIPASYPGKDLSNVEQSIEEQRRLNDKLTRMIASGKARPMSEKQYFENILHNPEMLSGITFVFAIDFDLMLLNGFGCTDRKDINGYSYEYGLFPVISNKMADEPIATYNSQANYRADFNLEVNANAEIIGDNSNLRLHWRFDLLKFREKEIKGFNIYFQNEDEERKPLSDKTIWITSNNNPVDLNYLTEFPDTKTNYYAVPVSYFGTEREGFKLSFNPDMYRISIPAPELSFVIDDKTLKLQWQLNHGYDTLISSFKLMKKESKNFEIMAILEPASRNHIEKMLGEEEKARYKIIAETRSGKEVWSNEIIVNYSPKTNIATPENLAGEIINREDAYFIKLTWAYPDQNSEIAFRIFTDGPNGNLIYDSSYPQNLESPVEIEVKKVRGEIKHFAIQAITLEREKSQLSNQIEIIIPTSYLPPIYLTQLEVEDGNLEVDWKFSDEIVDLKGFKILIDDDVYLSEEQIDKGSRTTLLKGLSSGRHSIIISAVTQYGIEKATSKKSFMIP